MKEGDNGVAKSLIYISLFAAFLFFSDGGAHEH
jgi:hypothetical protein